MSPQIIQAANLMTILFALGIGSAFALLGWLVSSRVAEVPAEDRKYKDAPPLGFRLVWAPIQWISHFIGPVLHGKSHAQMLMYLRKAGLDYALSPAQFMAARVVCGVTLSLIFGGILYTFEGDPGEPGIELRYYLQACAVGALFGYAYPAIWLSDLLAKRKAELLKALPFYLDIITLCVEAGLNMQGAMTQAVAKGPKGVLREEFQRVLRDIRAGKARAESLRAMGDRLGEPNVANFTTAVIQAETMGMNLGPILRAQADQRRTERFLRAEKLAMEAPVKMLFPLIAFIFPCTFIVLFFPIAMKFMHSGM